MWNWLPVVGTAGGVLVGVKEDMFDITQCDIHTFCISCILKFKNKYTKWRLISVYGSAYDESKLDFLNELNSVLAEWSGPTLIGGDFNLVRNTSEKNTGNINQHWADLFNDWVNNFGLIEIKNAGRRFTWANN